MSNFSAASFLVLVMAAGAAGCTNPGVAITSRVMDAHEATAYNEYLKEAAQINIEREKAGLEPTPILSRAEWAGRK